MQRIGEYRPKFTMVEVSHEAMSKAVHEAFAATAAPQALSEEFVKLEALQAEAMSLSNYLMVVSLSARDRAVAGGRYWSVVLPEAALLTVLTVSALAETFFGVVLSGASLMLLPFSTQPTKRCFVYTLNASGTVVIAMKNLIYNNFCQQSDKSSIIKLGGGWSRRFENGHLIYESGLFSHLYSDGWRVHVDS